MIILRLLQDRKVPKQELGNQVRKVASRQGFAPRVPKQELGNQVRPLTPAPPGHGPSITFISRDRPSATLTLLVDGQK